MALGHSICIKRDTTILDQARINIVSAIMLVSSRAYRAAERREGMQLIQRANCKLLLFLVINNF